MVKRDPVFRDQFRHQLATGERHKLGVDLWDALARVGCPVLALRATHSDMFAAETVPKMRQANARISLVEIVSGHHIAADNPDSLVGETRAFLSQSPFQESR